MDIRQARTASKREYAAPSLSRRMSIMEIRRWLQHKTNGLEPNRRKPILPPTKVASPQGTVTQADNDSSSRKPLQLPTVEHMLLRPLEHPAQGAEDARDECLLAIVPGALLAPIAFKALAQAVQQAAGPHLRLWVGVLNVDLLETIGGPSHAADLAQALKDQDVYGKLVDQLVKYAIEQGFVPRRESAARVSNLVVLSQSFGAIACSGSVVRMSAATILLAGMPNSPEYIRLDKFSIESWPRPLMMLVGELDGQLRWPLLSPYIAEAAAMATKFGPRFVAAYKPVVVVPGLNHGNTSNGEARTQRGDITAGVMSYQSCMNTLGDLIASFTTAHVATAAAAKSQASKVLLDAVRQGMQLTAPYCVALGLGDPAGPFTAATAELAAPPSGPLVGACRVGGLVVGAQRTAGVSKPRPLHPGELVAAEAHAVQLQHRVLSELPRAELQQLKVVATVHTDVEAFLYSQPLMISLEAAEEEDGQDGHDSSRTRWLLNVQVLLHYTALEEPMSHLAPRAPDYWIKLKCAHFIAAMLGLPNPAQYGTPLPAELNRLALDSALKAAPPHVVERYRSLGRQMMFGPDVNAEGPGAYVSDFVQKMRVTWSFTPGEDDPPSDSAAAAAAAAAASGQLPPPPSQSAGAAAAAERRLAPVRVISPYVLISPPEDVASLPLSETRFHGPFYVKVMSVAQAMEWICLDSLRVTETPW